MNKKVIYTAIINDYDNLKDPHYVNEDYDYICFTNQTFSSNVWKIVNLPVEMYELSPSRANRCLKWLPHRYLSEYDFSIYIDGSVQIIDNLNELMSNNTENRPMSLLPHNKRVNVWQEFNANIIQNKDSSVNLNRLFEFYVQQQVLTNHHNLYHQCCLFRYHNTNIVKQFDEDVWEMICNYTFRDQLITPYIVEKNNLNDYIYIFERGMIDKYINYNDANKHKYNV